MIEIRKFDPTREDYAAVTAWWEARDWKPIPLDHLGIGFIAESAGQKLCAAWLYLNGSAFGTFEFLVSNPEAPARLKHKAITTLIDYMLGLAKAAGVKSIWTSVAGHAKSLSRLYQKHGFQLTDSNVVHLIARL